MQQASGSSATPPATASSKASWLSSPRLQLGLAALLTLASLLLPIAGHGLWEPHELALSDWGRRTAVHLFGAESLALPGSNNLIPTVEEVGRGELPVLSVAASVSLFGLEAWAVRLPMAIWALLGVAATTLACHRLASPRSARWAAVILATMPLFFGHARTALGDVVTMSALAVTFAALALACFDARLRPWQRAVCVATGGVFAVAGLYCRGALIGIALPTLSVGLAWLVSSRPVRDPKDHRLLVGGGCVAIGTVAAIVGVAALVSATADDYRIALGSAVDPLKKLATHDAVIHYLGHGLFPYAAVAPLVAGVLLRAPSGSADEKRRTGSFRLGLVLVVGLGVLFYGVLAPQVGLMPFGPVFAIALLIALAADSLDRFRHGAPAVAMGCAALLAVLFKDFRDSPDKAFSAFVVGSVQYPEDFVGGSTYLAIAFALAAVAFPILAVERVRFVRGALAWAARRLGVRRSALMLAPLVASAMSLSLGYYPALAAQVSPAGVFERYRELAEPGEPLATIGTDPRNALYFQSGPAENFAQEHQALKWLKEPEPRRWMVVKASRLPSLNARFRRQSKPALNLPVLASGGDSYLISSRLGPSEADLNPYREIVLSDAPQMRHPMAVEFDGKLRLLGWEVRSARGEVTDEVRRGKKYEFRMAYEVLGRISREWKTFIHIDGHDQRFNGDHDTLGGVYPMKNWRKGDFVLDRYEFTLGSSYPVGTYEAYFGLFKGKKRFKVSKGEHKDDRLLGGKISVRK